MKRLIVVRHGEYGDNGGLNTNGQAQIDALADRLHRLIDRASVLILSSTAVRARESAKILAKAFGGGIIEDYEVLWSESRHPEDLPAALALVKSRQDLADVIILVTHLEYTELLPAYFCRMVLDIHRPSQSLRNGRAWVIDCELKTLELV